MPPQIQALAERKGQLFYFFKYALVFLVTLGATHLSSISVGKLWHISPYLRESAVQTLSFGLFTAISRQVFLVSFPRATVAFLAHPVSRVSQKVWVVIFIVGAAVEETWRGLALGNAVTVGWSPLLATVVSSIAFVFGRLTGIPSRVTGVKEEGIWEFAVGCLLAMLYLGTGSVIVPLGVNVIASTTNLYLLRRRATATTQGKKSEGPLV